jgi:DNA-binding protein HU-beta
MLMKTPAEAKTKAKPKSAAKSKAPTISLTHLAKELGEAHGLSRKDASALLQDMMGRIAKGLKKGSRVRLNGIGVLQVRKRPARMGRNPATGAQIKIKASKKVAFRAAKELKETV